MKKAEKAFKEMTTGLTRKSDFEKWSSSIFFFKGDKWMFDYDLNSGYLWCRHNDCWNVLEKLLNGSYSEVQYFIKNKVEEHFKSKPVTPLYPIDILGSAVEEHFKSKPVTPLYPIDILGSAVEEHFKSKPVTPGFEEQMRLLKVEEHFKSKPVTPYMISFTYGLNVEGHFKGKPVTPENSMVSADTTVEEHFKGMSVTPKEEFLYDVSGVEEHFKSKEVTPSFHLSNPNMVEGHFKSKSVTPVVPKGILQKSVEEHFKNKEVTPCSTTRRRRKAVEEHFKGTQSEQYSFFDLFPLYTFYNERNVLHHTELPSLIFPDGECFFFYKGVYLRYELFHKLKTNTITFEEWVKEENEEVKSAILSYIEEVYGNEVAYRFISSRLKEVNTYIDKKDKKYLVGTTGGMNIGVYTLFKGVIKGVSVVEDTDGRERIKNEITLAYIRCYCPSTDRMFFLGVNPKYDNAKDAIASLYKIPKKLSTYIDYINRQGERFSTVLTEQGKKLRKLLKKEDIQDLVCISGDEYFSKMRYEY